MKKILVVLSLVLAPIVGFAQTLVSQGPGSNKATPWAVNAAAQTNGRTTEVLVGITSTATPSPALLGRRSIEVQNLGPNPIFCALNAPAVLNKSRQITTNSSWDIDLGPGVVVNCICSVLQVTGAATIVTEVR